MQIRKKIFQNIEKNEWTGVVNYMHVPIWVRLGVYFQKCKNNPSQHYN